MMIGALLLACGIVYAMAYRRVRVRARSFPRAAPVAFAAGLTTIAAALSPPFDALSDASLSWHMLQHLALISIAAPLVLFGAPVRLALAALPASAASRLARTLNSAPVRSAGHPLFGLALLVGVLYGTHFSPLYERALENDALHAFEHAAYLSAGLAFWAPIFAVAPAPHAPGHPVRILALFLSLPATAFLGVALYVGSHPLYPHYAVRPGALTDQANAGELMWLSSGAPVLLALLWCLADWGARERRLGVALDGPREMR